MKTLKHLCGLLAALVLGLTALTGCESTGDGGGTVSGGVYYGVGFYDPWYYGGYYHDVDVIVTPPGDRHDWGARPTHPIARPTPAPSTRPAPSARPMPSIPSTPRPSFRR